MGLPSLILGESTNPENILDVKFSYSTEEAYRVMTDLGKDARSLYMLSALLVDMPHPLFYGFYYALSIVTLFGGWKHSKLSVVIILPLLAASFDFLENIGMC